jgi:hypothetical protein
MLYRRHLRSCPHRRGKRNYRRCQCPIWLDARVDGRRVHKSTRVADWNTAQELARKWIVSDEAVAPIQEKEPPPEPVNPPSISVNAALDSFVSQAKARKLHASTIHKYDLLRRQMEEFVQGRGIQFLKDFDLAALEAFQAKGEEGALTALKKLDRIKAFFWFALDRKWISDNPARLLSVFSANESDWELFLARV